MPRIGAAGHDLVEDAAPFGEVVVASRRAGRPLAQPREPLLVVPLAPGADHAAPLVDGQLDAAALVDPPVRLVLGRLAVEDDAVEIEHHRRRKHSQ